MGSPLKKQRASVSQADENALRRRIESGLSQPVSGALDSAASEGHQTAGASSNPFEAQPQKPDPRENEDEEL